MCLSSFIRSDCAQAPAILLLLAAAGNIPLTHAAEVDISKLPPPAARQVDFAKDIQPILEKSCLKCHCPEQAKGKLLLDTREHALKGGENGPAILPGQSAKSSLIHFTARLVDDSEMPPIGKGEPLTRDQVALLRAWIDQGLKWPASVTLLNSEGLPPSGTKSEIRNLPVAASRP